MTRLELEPEAVPFHHLCHMGLRYKAGGGYMHPDKELAGFPRNNCLLLGMKQMYCSWLAGRMKSSPGPIPAPAEDRTKTSPWI